MTSDDNIPIAQYRAGIYNLCYSFLRNHDDAEDATQQTFLHALKNIDAFRHESKVSAWLWGIAKHVCLEILRRRQNRVNRNTVPLETAVETSLPEDRSPEERMIEEWLATDLRSQLVEAIREGAGRKNWLATDYKLYTYRIVDGLEYSAIAERLGRTAAYWGTRFYDKIRPVLDEVLKRFRSDLNVS